MEEIYKRIANGDYTVKGDHPSMRQFATKKDTLAAPWWRRRQVQSELNYKLEQDLADEHGVTLNPKRQLLWQHAWDRGHGDGLHQVAEEYDSLVELIK